jgi:molybdopterin converting factor subunit 1
MKTIRVRYFALLREQRGQEEELVQTGAATPAELYRELAGRHRLTLPEARLRVAINEEFGSWTAPLCADDRVAFIPPVAGG